MSKENSSIHEFDINLICEYFSNVERQGPGSPEATLKALSFIDNLTPNSRIADLGCGTGGQTMILGQNTPGHITGIDLFPDFINIFNRNAKLLGLQERVKGIVGSMDDLPFEKGELDLIWSEGAIYNIGFEKGISLWREYLKPGGYLAVTEAAWFKADRPKEIEDFWMDAYPQIDTIPNHISKLEKAGYVPLASFMLPEYCWQDNFFAPQVEAQKRFLLKYPGNKMAEDLIANLRHEKVLYDKYSDYYGYVFYIARKSDR